MEKIKIDVISAWILENELTIFICSEKLFTLHLDT